MLKSIIIITTVTANLESKMKNLNPYKRFLNPSLLTISSLPVLTLKSNNLRLLKNQVSTTLTSTSIRLKAQLNHKSKSSFLQLRSWRQHTVSMLWQHRLIHGNSKTRIKMVRTSKLLLLNSLSPRLSHLGINQEMKRKIIQSKLHFYSHRTKLSRKGAVMSDIHQELLYSF